MKNNSIEPPKLAIKVANAVFGLGVLYSVLVAVYAIYRIYKPYGIDSSPGPYVFYMSFSVSSAIVFGLGLRLSNDLKINITLLFITIGVLLYGFESYLEIRNGYVGYPAIMPAHFVNSNGLSTNNGRMYPLGGMSNVTIRLGNESDYHALIETDEHGFNNPKGLYKENSIDIMLTGDSFTEGYAVYSDETIGAVLRESGLNVINVGKGSNGPLAELATLKEFAEPLEPRIVLWLYFKNDISDLRNEMKSSFLRRYVNEDDFSQNLISRQDDVEAAFINHGYRLHWFLHSRLFKIFKFANLRSGIIRMRATVTAPAPVPELEEELGLVFNNILAKAKQMVSGWGGRIYFVYLPGFVRYSLGEEHRFRESVLLSASQLDIPVIDIDEEVTESRYNPLSLFTSRGEGGHYSTEGYRFVAEAIGKRLKADGVIP